MEPRSKFQFGIGRLLILTTAVAVVIAAILRIKLPNFFLMILACYFIPLAVWLVVRSPGVYRELRKFQQGLQLARERRRQLESELQRRRRENATERASLRNHDNS